MENMIKTSANAHKFKKKYEKVDDTRITESAGYLTAKQRIENILVAGQKLMAHRKEQYDFQSGQEIDEYFEDPTRDLSFDMADASQINNKHLQDVEDAKESDKMVQKALLEEEKALEKEAKTAEFLDEPQPTSKKKKSSKED